MSLPSAAAQSSAATDAAAPPDEPPGTLDVSYGFLTPPKYDVCEEPPMANSSMLVLPRITACCDFNLRTAVASYGGIKSSSIFDAQVVFKEFVQILSFTDIGIPVRGADLFSSISFCAASASFRALSAHTVI